MRKAILTIGILTIVSVVFAGTMNIHMNDGTTVNIEISEIDMITFEPSDTPNLVQNPGFEDGLNYWDPFQYPSGWSSSLNNPHSGSRCAEFSFPSGSGYYDASIRSSGDQIYVEANTPYSFSFWIREKDTHDTYDPNTTIVDPGINLNGTWYGAPSPSPSESWQFVSTTITFSESGYAVVYFELHGYATSDLAEFAVDDVVLKEDTPNLVQNPGFEDGLNYWDPFQYPSGWSSSLNNPHSGSRCAEFSFPSGSGYYDASIRSSGDQIYVEANTPYSFSFWIREKDTHDTYDPNTTIVDPGINLNGTWYGAPSPSPSESWQFVSTTITFSESGYAVVYFELHGYATSDLAEFAVDDVVLKEQ